MADMKTFSDGKNTYNIVDAGAARKTEVGNLESLTTTKKDNLVTAVNELSSRMSHTYCKYLNLGSTGVGIALKLSKTSWIKRSALIIGCDNTSGVIHEVVAVHYDPSKDKFIAYTSGTKEWSVDQESGKVSTSFIANSEILVIHTGFTEIEVIS